MDYLGQSSVAKIDYFSRNKSISAFHKGLILVSVFWQKTCFACPLASTGQSYPKKLSQPNLGAMGTNVFPS